MVLKRYIIPGSNKTQHGFNDILVEFLEDS